MLEILKGRKEVKDFEKRKKQNIEEVITGKTLILTNDYEIAEAILEWCGREEKPVQYFLQCLSNIGVNAPIKIKNIKKTLDGYHIVIIDDDNEKEIRFRNAPKELSIIRDGLTIQYDIKECKLTIKGQENKIKYWQNTRGLKISLKNGICMTLERINLKEDEKLYENLYSLFKEIVLIPENSMFHECYTKIKECIQKYYNLKGTNITLVKQSIEIQTCDSEIILYTDIERGIYIQKGKSGYCKKEYREGKAVLTWAGKKFICEGVANKDIQEYINKAEKAIQEVEGLEY